MCKNILLGVEKLFVLTTSDSKVCTKKCPINSITY